MFTKKGISMYDQLDHAQISKNQERIDAQARANPLSVLALSQDDTFMVDHNRMNYMVDCAIELSKTVTPLEFATLLESGNLISTAINRHGDTQKDSSGVLFSKADDDQVTSLLRRFGDNAMRIWNERVITKFASAAIVTKEDIAELEKARPRTMLLAPSMKYPRAIEVINSKSITLGSYGAVKSFPCEWPLSPTGQKPTSGMTIVVGGTGSGKSIALKQTGSYAPDVVIRNAEPAEAFENQLASTDDFMEAIELAVVLSAMGLKVAIDGARALLFALRGAAAAGGITASIFTATTVLNNLFSRYGLHVMCTLNPMMPNDKILDVYNNIGASVSSAIWIANDKMIRGQYRGVVKREFFPVRGQNEEFTDGMLRSYEPDFRPSMGTGGEVMDDMIDPELEKLSALQLHERQMNDSDIVEETMTFDLNSL